MAFVIYIPLSGQPCLIAPVAAVIQQDAMEMRIFGWARIFDSDSFISVSGILKSLRKRDGIHDGARTGVEL